MKGEAPPVRVRFAPSPTGPLHIGNVRTALVNWLFARRRGGAFVLRIEDTDPERSRPEFERAIFSDLAWLGLDWDEGPDRGGAFGPYRQSERRGLYAERLGRLLADGRAYRCFCTAERLAADAEELKRRRKPPRYVGRCREIAPEEARRRAEAGEPHTARFRAPHGKTLLLPDLVRGHISFATGSLEDFMLVRSDGRPSYNFAVVVDDALMKITHVLRGEDHLANTPKQVLLAEALGVSPPAFGHLPLLLGADHAPLSKRHGRASLADLRAAGTTPEGLLNYLALCGWSPPDGKEVLSLTELSEAFDLSRVGGGGSVFDEKKLAWIDAHHLHAMPPERIAALARDLGLDPPGAALIEAIRPNLRSVRDVADYAAIFRGPVALSSDWVRAMGAFGDAAAVIGAARARAEAADFDAFVAAVKKAVPGAKGKALFMPLRLALTGREDGPELRAIFDLLPRAELRRRLEAAEAKLRG